MPNGDSSTSENSSTFRWVVRICLILVAALLLEHNFRISFKALDEFSIATSTFSISDTPTLGSSSDTFTLDTIVHWNSTDHVTLPTIYTCHGGPDQGFREAKKLFRSVFPEYRIVDLDTFGMKIGQGKPPKLFPPNMLWPNYTNSYDMVIDRFPFITCNNVISSWLMSHFNGHFVLFSGESETKHPVNHLLGNRKNFHSFGPLVNPTPGDAIITYLQYVWWDQFQNIMTPELLLDGNKRPKGLQETFMVYANSNCVSYREEAVARLSRLGIVHCRGRCFARWVSASNKNQTNIIRFKDKITIRTWSQNVEVYRHYQFCFVMEHDGSHPAYITEKILMAFIAGCIPIYYGPPMIFDIFNEKSFVFYNISNPEPALDRVKALRDDKDLYNSVLSEPIAANKEIIEKYFSFNDTIGNGHLKKQLRKRLGLTDSNFVA
mmetsp:Transcript_16848/g.25480  ORF Transcript_16848/g.25480 Transcript_16848/m.25480 type:complete len:434 (-) Transcript_16848:61-1362(-)